MSILPVSLTLAPRLSALLDSVSPIIVIITAFSNLFGTGGAPIFSIERGKGNHAKAGLLMNTSFTLLTLCAVILMIAGLLFARPILVLFGASDAGLAYAYPYLMIYLLGTFPSMAATGMNPFINAQGYATTGMTSVIIGAVANLLLDPLFIFVFGLGIKGAAIATIISQTLSAAFVLYFLHYKAEYRIRFLSKTELASCGEDAKNIVSLGTAGFIMQLTNSLVTICANNVLFLHSCSILIQQPSPDNLPCIQVLEYRQNLQILFPLAIHEPVLK